MWEADAMMAWLDTYADAARWLNVGLACAVVILLTAGAIARWDSMPARIKRISPWIICTYGVIAYGSGEIAASDTPVDPGIRVLLMVLTLLGLVIAALYGIRDEDY